jgi:hypothetical protein
MEPEDRFGIEGAIDALVLGYLALHCTNNALHAWATGRFAAVSRASHLADLVLFGTIPFKADGIGAIGGFFRLAVIFAPVYGPFSLVLSYVLGSKLLWRVAVAYTGLHVVLEVLVLLSSGTISMYPDSAYQRTHMIVAIAETLALAAAGALAVSKAGRRAL